MRTTVTFADDVAAAIEQLRRERGMGVSEAVNELVRRGLTVRPERKPFVQKTSPIGLRIDVTDVWGAIEQIEAMEAAEE